MLYYEFKKVFGKRRYIALLVLVSIITCFFTMIMCQLTKNGNYEIWPFEEYLSYYWLYGMSILYVIIFVHVLIFAIEEKNAMLQILLVSQFGKDKLAKTKIILALFVTNILTTLFIMSSLVGYSVAFNFNFNIPIIEYYNTIYVAESNLDTSGSMLLVNIISYIITANFTALFSMYFTAKFRNAYLVCILLFIGCFMTLFSFNPEIGIIFSLMPLGNYIVIANTLKKIFSIGSVSVTPHLLSIGFTIVLIWILLIKIKKIYMAPK